MCVASYGVIPHTYIRAVAPGRVGVTAPAAVSNSLSVLGDCSLRGTEGMLCRSQDFTAKD